MLPRQPRYIDVSFSFLSPRWYWLLYFHYAITLRDIIPLRASFHWLLLSSSSPPLYAITLISMLSRHDADAPHYFRLRAISLIITPLLRYFRHITIIFISCRHYAMPLLRAMPLLIFAYTLLFDITILLFSMPLLPLRFHYMLHYYYAIFITMPLLFHFIMPCF